MLVVCLCLHYNTSQVLGLGVVGHVLDSITGDLQSLTTSPYCITRSAYSCRNIDVFKLGVNSVSDWFLTFWHI